MSQITSYYSLRGEVSFVKLHRVPLRGVARVGSVLDHAEVDIDRVYSVQCGDGEPMVLYQSPVTAMWETFQDAYIPDWLYDRVSEIFGCTMNALVPSGTREMHFVLKEGPLREKLPVPVVIGGRRSHMVANANDCVGEVLMRVRFATKTEVRRPRGTVSINCSGPLRLCEEIGQVMRRHPGCPLVVSSDAPARAPLELVPQFGRISFSIEFCEGSESEEDGETWDDVLNAPMPHMSVEALPALYVSDDGIWRSEEALAASLVCANVAGLEHSLASVLDSLDVKNRNLLRGVRVRGDWEHKDLAFGRTEFQFVPDEPLPKDCTFRVAVWGGRVPHVVWFVKPGFDAYVSIPFI